MPNLMGELFKKPAPKNGPALLNSRHELATIKHLTIPNFSKS